MDHMVIACANTISNWKMRREANGKPVSQADLKREICFRWPTLSETQIAAVMAATQKPRDARYNPA